MKLETWFERRLVLAIGSDAHITGCHALYAAVIVVQNLRSGEAWENLSAEFHRLLT